MSDSLGDASGQHAEGVQHIASNTAPPDTSRGTEGGVGTGAESSGVSDFKSPLYPGHENGAGGSNLQQSSSQSSGGGMVETVKSYLGMGSSSGAGAAETGQLGTTGDSRNVAEDNTTGSGSGAGVTGAAATAASAVGLGSGNAAAGGGMGSTSSTSGAEVPRESTNGSTTGGSTMEAAKEKVQEATGTGENKPVTSGTDDHKPPQPAGGKPHKLENESAIPTAGGERLGEKHWGESKIVPDNPEKRASAAGVSSEEGQPTQQTTDNTAKNTGTATGPPPASGSGNNAGSGAGEEKPKMMDKVKDKLHMGGK